MRDDGGTILGVDWRVPLDRAWRTIGHEKGIQGNLDPGVLLGPADVIRREVADVLARAEGRRGHIFNLGHGILPETNPDAVKYVVDLVHDQTIARL